MGHGNRALGLHGPRPRHVLFFSGCEKDAPAFDDGVLRQNFSDLLDGRPEVADDATAAFQ